MLSKNNFSYHFQHSRGFRLTKMALALCILFLFMGAVWHSIIRAASSPDTTVAQNAPCIAPANGEWGGSGCAGEGKTAVSATTTLAPFLDIVPSSDGTELFIQAGGVGQLGGNVFLNLGSGPTHHKGGWTMTYSTTVQAYLAIADGFTPGVGASGPINITTTQGLDSGVVDFKRAYLPPEPSCPGAPYCAIVSEDGNLELGLVNTDTFPAEVYIAVVPSYAPPGPLPPGHHLIGSAYSVRASGALVEADRPMNLRLFYNQNLLAGADPHTLTILAWDAHNKHWDNLGGILNSTQRHLSVAAKRLTTYALAAIPAWRDEFYDLSGMEPLQFNNVTWGGPQNPALLLASAPGNGSALSLPISATAGFTSWDTITFANAADPPTTTLSVDVLSSDGFALLTNVASGTSLTGLDPAQYPVLKLRLTITSTAAGETPTLDSWQLGWQVAVYKTYLPAVLR